jgi:hypothetical protein
MSIMAPMAQSAFLLTFPPQVLLSCKASFLGGGLGSGGCHKYVAVPVIKGYTNKMLFN